MITYKCKNCAGEVTINASGDLVCPYCGSKANFSDRELREYKDFRKRMLDYLTALAQNESNDAQLDSFWQMADTEEFTSADGNSISIKYIYKCEQDGVTMFCARNNVIYVFPSNKSRLAQSRLKSVSELVFPEADMRGLRRLVPELSGRYDLKDGAIMLVYSKPDDMLPLPLYGNLPYEHVAWIVSRLENIACLLCYNNMYHTRIEPDSIFINAKTHEAALYGGWWNTYRQESGSYKDLEAVRDTAKKVLGPEYDSIPRMFKSFLKEKPASNAYEDFERWDEVIEKGLGGRHFHKLDINAINK